MGRVRNGYGGRSRGSSAVRDVFEWLSTEGVRIDNALYVPDQVLVDYKAEIDHYPRQYTLCGYDRA